MQAMVPILGSVAIGVIGQISLKSTMTRVGPVGLRHGQAVNTILAIALNPGVWAGFGLYGVSILLWLAGLSQVELGYAFPFLSLSYVFILLGSRVWLGEAIGGMRLIGVLAICMGVSIVAAG
jgi:drug/metabolite transporter (DMT)-like permease